MSEEVETTDEVTTEGAPLGDPLAPRGVATRPQEHRSDIGEVVDGGFSETVPTPDVSRTHQSSPFEAGEDNPGEVEEVVEIQDGDVDEQVIGHAPGTEESAAENNAAAIAGNSNLETAKQTPVSSPEEKNPPPATTVEDDGVENTGNEYVTPQGGDTDSYNSEAATGHDDTRDTETILPGGEPQSEGTEHVETIVTTTDEAENVNVVSDENLSDQTHVEDVTSEA